MGDALVGYSGEVLLEAAVVMSILVGSALVLVLGWDPVQIVGDIAEIPRSLPLPKLPDPSLVGTWALRPT